MDEVDDMGPDQREKDGKSESKPVNVRELPGMRMHVLYPGSGG